jgi:hypothetical protein
MSIPSEICTNRHSDVFLGGNMLQSFSVDNVFSNKRMTFSRNAQNFAFFGVEFEPPELSLFFHISRFSLKDTGVNG